MTPAISYWGRPPVHFYHEKYSVEIPSVAGEVHLSLQGNGHCVSVNCHDCPCSLGNGLTCDNNTPAILLELVPDAINQLPEYYL